MPHAFTPARANPWKLDSLLGSRRSVGLLRRPRCQASRTGTSTKLHRQPGRQDDGLRFQPGWQASTSRNGGARSAILNSFRLSSDPSPRTRISRSRSARLQQARARQFAAAGAALPKAELTAGAGFGTGSDNSRGRVSETLHSAANTGGFDHVDEAGGLDTAWELDIFGKLRREIEASHLDALAAAKARDAVLVAVIANVAQGVYRAAGFSGPARGNSQEHRNRPA